MRLLKRENRRWRKMWKPYPTRYESIVLKHWLTLWNIVCRFKVVRSLKELSISLYQQTGLRQWIDSVCERLRGIKSFHGIDWVYGTRFSVSLLLTSTVRAIECQNALWWLSMTGRRNVCSRCQKSCCISFWTPSQIAVERSKSFIVQEVGARTKYFRHKARCACLRRNPTDHEHHSTVDGYELRRRTELIRKSGLRDPFTPVSAVVDVETPNDKICCSIEPCYDRMIAST